MHFKLISIFPDIFKDYFKVGILAKAIDKKLIKVSSYNLRDYTEDKHKQVDDSPYGGGAGMLFKFEPIYKAIKNLKKKKNTKVILLSAGGKTWNHQMAKKYSKLDELILICGRYEGVDARVNKIIDEEISIGNFVLSGGELPALVLIDSISRLLPNVLGNKESLNQESHSQIGLVKYPQYTKPAIIQVDKKKYSVPKVLLSGDHKKIAQWRQKKNKLK
jgi:tRNA (guanine37-N1)-methyltransferase